MGREKARVPSFGFPTMKSTDPRALFVRLTASRDVDGRVFKSPIL